MKKKALIIFGLAIVVGVSAVWLIHDWMNKRTTQVAQKTISTTKVVIAKGPLAFGSVIRSENLDVIDWPTRIVPHGSFRTIKDLVNDKEPRVVLRPVEANEPILKTKVSGFGGRASLSAVISEEMRGATIRVNDVNGVAGFVLPGDRVDVLLTRDGNGGNKAGTSANLITDVLLQNVKVLAIDQDLNESKDKPSVAKAVTLEVTAIQAQKLVLGQTVGSLTLALRNGKNTLAARTPTVRIADLRDGEVNDARTNAKSTAGAATKPASGGKPIVKMRRYNTLSKVKVVRGTKESEYKVVRERASSTLPSLKSKTGHSTAAPSKSTETPVTKAPTAQFSTPGNDLPFSLIANRRTVPAAQ